MKEYNWDTLLLIAEFIYKNAKNAKNASTSYSIFKLNYKEKFIFFLKLKAINKILAKLKIIIIIN